jgi:hypothetical protein
MTQAELIQASFAAAELIDLDIETRAALAKSSQLQAMEDAREAGDEFAAYWASSASASVMAHYRWKAVR